MTSLNSNSPSPNEDSRPDHLPHSASRKSTVRLTFIGNSFEPSDETEVGKTLLHHLHGRTDTKPYPVNFSKTYNVELTRRNGSLIFPEPISVKGFIIGPNPNGEPAVLALLSDKREKIRLPMLFISEDDSNWRVADSRIGWNSVVLKAIENEKNGSKIVTFKQPGIFLVIASDNDSEVLQLPVLVKKVRITPGGLIKEAVSSNGEILKPRRVEVDLSQSSLPAAELGEAEPGETEDYTLAPLTPSAAAEMETFGGESESTAAKRVDNSKKDPKPSHPATPRELRDSRIEGSLTRLFQREFKRASKSNKSPYVAILGDAREYMKRKTEPLTHAFKQTVLGATESSKTKLIVHLVERWQRHHQERNLFTEAFWSKYYEELATIAPLLLQLSGDIARFGEPELKRKKKKG